MKIFDRLPLLPQSQVVGFGHRQVRMHRSALVVWISIGLGGEEDPQRISPPFPALLDSGNNCEAYLHQQHLIEWAGISPALMPLQGSKKINEQHVPFREADIWIHPNTPGTHQRRPGVAPHRMDLEDGVAVGPPRPDQSIFPRVPLIGLSALHNNGLDFWFDSKSGHAFARTADWRSHLVRLLYRFL